MSDKEQCPICSEVDVEPCDLCHTLVPASQIVEINCVDINGCIYFTCAGCNERLVQSAENVAHEVKLDFKWREDLNKNEFEREYLLMPEPPPEEPEELIAARRQMNMAHEHYQRYGRGKDMG